jgi:hypothetical protein
LADSSSRSLILPVHCAVVMVVHNHIIKFLLVTVGAS